MNWLFVFWKWSLQLKYCQKFLCVFTLNSSILHWVFDAKAYPSHNDCLVLAPCFFAWALLVVQAKKFSRLPTFYSFLSLYHSFIFHSTLQDPARFSTFIWVALSCLSPKLFHAAIKPRNPCLTFTWTDNDILSFLWKNPLMLSHFIYAHLSRCTSLEAVSLISYLFSDSFHASVSLCHPFLLPQLSAASTFSCLLLSRFQKGRFVCAWWS